MRITQFAVGCLLAAVLAGCASKKAGPAFRAGDEQMPEFLNGPAVVYLTNAPGFSAHLDTDIARPYGEGRPISGALLQRQGRLVFQPDQIVPKKKTGAGMIFIWDANLRQGWAVSEALQGYAPAKAALEITNVQIDTGSAVPDTIQIHPCHRMAARVTRADGSVAAYKIWQADDLRHFPIRIQSDSAASPPR